MKEKMRNAGPLAPASLAALTAALFPLGVFSPASASTLRIAEYNIDCSDQGNNNNITGPNNGVPTILAAMGVHSLAGNSQPIDILALTEMLDTNNNNITSTTLPALVTAFNNIYGAGTYAYVNTPDATSGGTQFNGPSGFVYNTKTVQVLGAASLLYSGNSSNSNPRAPMRAEFQPIGFGSNSDFYMYVSHMKSGTTSSDVNERAQEATIIRNDEATLPANSSVIYTGDYNSNPPEAEFTILTGSGQGQAFDPEGFSTSTQWWSESTDGLEYRDDYEMMTTNVLNDTGPLDYVTNSFQVFGNNGTTPSGGKTNATGNTALSDLSNRTTVLNDLMQPYGSDHMPVEADYKIGVGLASLTWDNAGTTLTNNGMTWDVNNYFNWNNGSNAATFVNGNTVTFNDVNNTHYTVTLNTTVTPASVTVNNSSGVYTISGTGTIAGSGSLTKSGTSTLFLTTANTFTGGVNLDAGVLNFSNLVNLGTGTVTFAGGTLQYGSGNIADVSALPVLLSAGGGTIDTGSNNVTLGNPIGDSGAGGLTKAGSGTLTLNAAETYTGNTVAGAGTLVIGATGSVLSTNITASVGGVLTINAGGSIPSGANLTDNGIVNEKSASRSINSLNGSGTLNLSGTALSVSNGGTFSGTIADNGTGGSLVSAGGTLTLSGSNNYSGGTTVSGGMLQTGANGALGAGKVVVNSPGILDLDGHQPTIGNLSGGGTVDNVSAGGNVTLTINTTGSSIFSGTIRNTTGTVAVTVAGTGSQTLSGVNTYSGATTISGGTLLAGAANALSRSSSVSVTGGTLDVSGFANQIAGLTVGSAGTLNLGIGNLLDNTGTASLAGTLNVSGTPSGSSVELMSYTSESGSFTNVPTFTGYNLVYAPTELELVLSGPANLTWNNASTNGLWDTSSSSNWNYGTSTTVFNPQDNVTFNDSNPSNTAANYSVTLNTTVNPGSVTVNNSLGNYSIAGTGTIGGTASLTKLGTGTLTLSTANTYSGGTNVSAGQLVIEPTSATTSALPTGALSISGNGSVQLASNVTQGSQSASVPNTAPTSNVNITSLSITGNGTLDIVNNHIIINYGGGADPISSIAQLITDGAYGGGTTVTWTGTGITSSAAASNPNYGIGYADSADPGNPAGLASGQIEIAYTLLGDANLDGKVNGTDFNLMATNFNQAVTNGWDEGDFNYDGKVNGNDFVLLAANFNQFASQSAVSSADVAALDSFAAANGISLASVPEPATMGILAVSVVGVLSRRRRGRLM